MRPRVRTPLAAAPPPSQVAVEPDAPQRPLGAGGGAVADLVLAALHLPQRPIGTAERGPEMAGLRFRRGAMARKLRRLPGGTLQGWRTTSSTSSKGTHPERPHDAYRRLGCCEPGRGESTQLSCIATNSPPATSS